MVGGSFKKEPSLSSASATRKSPCPRNAFVFVLFSFPPITTVGSIPPYSRTEATKEVVVVLPCDPATAIPYFSLINSASISARGIIGILFSLAVMTSGFSKLIAEDRTTTSTSAIFFLSWPSYIVAPRDESLWVRSVLFRSEPLTLYPRFKSSSAIPLIPIPPIPTKCM